jgi:hypothetical protein
MWDRMRIKGSRRSVLAATSPITLCLVVLVAWDSSAPMVPIVALGSVDEGTTIRTTGLLAELWSWDDGTENLVLVDPQSGCTVEVICNHGLCDQPSSYAELGDELEVVGEIFGLYAPRKLYTDSDRVSLIRPCRFVITVDTLSNCWQMFEGDDIEVRGILLRAEGGSGLSLRAMADEAVLSLEYAYEINQMLLGTEVVATGRLLFDTSVMGLVLCAESVVSTT